MLIKKKYLSKNGWQLPSVSVSLPCFIIAHRTYYCTIYLVSRLLPSFSLLEYELHKGKLTTYLLLQFQTLEQCLAYSTHIF